MDDEVLRFVRSGQKIEAIKRYRELYGVGLLEAKEAIDALAAGADPPPTQPDAPEDAAWRGEVQRLIEQGQLIAAIKRYRDETGLGLKEAKEAVEQLREQPQANPVASSPGDAIDQALRRGNRAEAIRLYRERHGVSHEEAVKRIESRALTPVGSGGKTGCFIATAAFGTPLAPQVTLLRRFRDRVLRRDPWGRRWVRWYYRWSPPVARLVARSATLRALVRWVVCRITE